MKIQIRDKSNILKWLTILFVVLLLVGIASFFIYRAVIRTEWYHSRQMEKGFEEAKLRLSQHDQINYLALDEEDEAWKYMYDVPKGLFLDMTCHDFKEISEEETIKAIWREDCIAVYFKNGGRTLFFITEEEEIYWGLSLKIECPSLLQWYKEHKGIEKINEKQ